jgi:putative transposase
MLQRNANRTLNRYEDRLAHIQRELCRRVKGSKNRAKSKAKVAKLHYRVANIRRYALNEVSNYLTAIAKPEIIVLEKLNINGMLQNRHLSKSIADASWSELKRQIEYKAKWQGQKVILADTFYPSSKTCSECGSVKPLLKLSERTYVCESCGLVIDRDLNAAINLASLAH